MKSKIKLKILNFTVTQLNIFRIREIILKTRAWILIPKLGLNEFIFMNVSLFHHLISWHMSQKLHKLVLRYVRDVSLIQTYIFNLTASLWIIKWYTFKRSDKTEVCWKHDSVIPFKWDMSAFRLEDCSRVTVPLFGFCSQSVCQFHYYGLHLNY